MRYEVKVREIHELTYVVEADSAEQAEGLVETGQNIVGQPTVDNARLDEVLAVKEVE